MVTFLRRAWKKYSKLGKNRKSKQVWRSPKGRDNKMREKRKGYPAVVSVGYKKEKEFRGKIENKKLKLIKNLKELEKVSKNELATIGNIGKKKKIELVKKAKEKGIEIYNLNVDKFLKKNTKEKKNESK